MDESLQVPGLRREGCSTGMVRRLRAGELEGSDADRVREHVKGCAACAKLLAELDSDAAEFAKSVPLEHFVSKTTALRESLASQKRRQRRRWVAGASMALAACLVVGIAGGLVRSTVANSGAGRNRHKGGGLIELYVGGTGQQSRLARDGETLSPGERVRIGYEAAEHRYLAVLSVDETGAVTPLYPESGESLRAETQPGVHLLPESVEFTGTGLERVVALFSDQPASVDGMVAAARRAYTRAGSVASMGALEIGGEQTSKLIRKK